MCVYQHKNEANGKNFLTTQYGMASRSVGRRTAADNRVDSCSPNRAVNAKEYTKAADSKPILSLSLAGILPSCFCAVFATTMVQVMEKTVLR
jgi:hypothetical protein